MNKHKISIKVLTKTGCVMNITTPLVVAANKIHRLRQSRAKILSVAGAKYEGTSVL